MHDVGPATRRSHGLNHLGDREILLAAEEIPDGATAYKCSPPIRESANRERLWEALRAGVIEEVVSDHSPSTVALKGLDGDFGPAWGGIASLQLGLPLVWSAARRRGFTLVDVSGWMAAGPARLAGLHRKGRIAVGSDADLCVFDPEATFTVEPETLFHRHPVTPYIGRALSGIVRTTVLRGEPVDPRQPRGRLLHGPT